MTLSLLYILGLIIGNFPNLIFDIRHDWYQTKTLYQYVLDALRGNGQNFSYYYLFVLWPLFCILLARLVTKFAKNNLVVFTFVIFYMVVSLNSKWISFTGAKEMPEGLRYLDVMKASEIIAKDNPQNFNVTTLFGFDARGYILRYPLKFNFNKIPQGEEQYKNIDTLYVMATGDNDILNPSRFELTAFLPFNYEKLEDVNESYKIYKLTKK